MLLQPVFSTFLLRRCASSAVTAASEPLPLRKKKAKSTSNDTKPFVDMKRVQTQGGRGGDGCVSFLSLWANEFAGPDGGDGGSGGHVLFQACENVQGLGHIKPVVKAESGDSGASKHCHGRNAPHTVIKVPVGTILRPLADEERVVGDLGRTGALFVAARGGAGGRGNHFFVSPTQQRPAVAEVGADGELVDYILELRSIANFGLLGMPNAGKSTLLQAISRARPKVASYPFTTIRPHLGVITYTDYDQITVADLPGLIEDSHKNRGLGVSFLRHVQRCDALIYMVDAAQPEPTAQLQLLTREVNAYSEQLAHRTAILVANKIDLPGAEAGLAELKKYVGDEQEIIGISARYGTNLQYLLMRLRQIYDSTRDQKHSDQQEEEEEENL